MSFVVRKFTTPWGQWMRRWTDPRMAPWHSPFFVADGSKEGFLAGPYLSERGEIRDELVHYPDFEVAARELNLRPGDFQAVSAWVEGLRPLGDVVVANADRALARALRHLRLPPLDKARYLVEMVNLTKMLLSAYRKAHGGDAELSPEARAQIEERNRRQHKGGPALPADLLETIHPATRLTKPEPN